MKKYLFGIAIFASFLALSCQEDKIEKGEPENLNGAWFVNTSGDINPTTVNLDADAKSFTYWLERYNNIGELEINILNYSDEVFTVPSKVKFENGAKRAELTVTFDSVPATNTLVSFEIAKENAAYYGGGFAKFNGYMNKRWETLGMGKFYDCFSMSTSRTYGVQDVLIMKSKVDPIYRIVDPYDEDQLIRAWGESFLGGGDCPYIDIELYTGEDGEEYFRWDKYWCNCLQEEGVEHRAYLPSVRNADNAENDFYSTWADENIIILYPEWYLTGLGGYGMYETIIALPDAVAEEGFDFEAWLDWFYSE